MSQHRLVPFVVLSLILPAAKLEAQQALGVRVNFGKNDIAGVVTSSKGPEAGAWVIAETKDLPTKFVRIVVTDNQGKHQLRMQWNVDAIDG